MSTREASVYCISGVRAGFTGAGRFLMSLERGAAELAEKGGPKVEFLYGPPGGVSLKQTLVSLRLAPFARELAARLRGVRHMARAMKNPAVTEAEHVVLFHPQNLTFAWCLEFLEKRAQKGQPTWIYVLDAGFFCTRSYNHLPHEDQPCLRCLGGDFAQARAHACPSLPRPQADNPAFNQRFLELGKSGALKFLVQCESYEDLIKRHFGPDCEVHVTGMWADFEELVGSEISLTDSDPKPRSQVVFHGWDAPAKGAAWSIGLARACPSVPFLFPFSVAQAQALSKDLPPNAEFRPMNWESGLAREVERSALTLCPSLWSAPIEGALVKTVALARAAGVVDSATAFCSEIPDDVLLKLDPDVNLAARQVEGLMYGRGGPDPRARQDWLDQFARDNRPVLANMLKAMGAV